MHRFVLAIMTSTVAIILCGSAGAHPVAGWVTDMEGDANGINGQHLLLDTGEGVATGPASYGPADLRSVDIKTTYEAIRVGADGLDYRATGLQIILRAEELPRSDGPTLNYRLTANAQGDCRSYFQAFVRGPSSRPEDPPNGTIEWYQLDASCREGVRITSMPFKATVSQELNAVVMEFTYAELSVRQREMLAPGSILLNPQGSVRTIYGTPAATMTAPVIDRTIFGPHWEVGSDIPADVPCTTGCA